MTLFRTVLERICNLVVPLRRVLAQTPAPAQPAQQAATPTPEIYAFGTEPCMTMLSPLRIRESTLTHSLIYVLTHLLTYLAN